MGGGISVCVALIGSYAPRVSYCDPQTKPCTPVERDASAVRPDVEVEYIPGLGLQRTAASVASVLLFASGLFAIAKAEEEQEELEPQLQLDQQIKIKRLELEANAELVNLENLAETKVRVYEQELKEAEAEMFFERNPEAIAQYLPKPEPIVSQVEAEKPLVIEEVNESATPEPDPLFFGVRLPETPQLNVEFWDWEWFNSRADDLPHIRVIAPTNGGKTTLCDWLVDVVPSEERKVITVKRKPHQWVGLPVYGVPFEYDVVRDQLEELLSEMVKRTKLMEQGQYKGKLSAIVDEWKAIARRVKAIKDEETKQIISPSAKEIMGDLLTLAREPGIRIFALAQGRQVITWGLEGESDILECFCTVYLGKFAVEEAMSLQRDYAKNSDEFGIWGKVIEFLKTEGKRAAWVETEFGKFPAIAPDLSKWKREIQSKGEKVNLVLEEAEIEDDQPPIPNPQSHDSDINEDLPPELLKVAVERLNQSLTLPMPDNANSQLSLELDDIVKQHLPVPTKESSFEWTVSKVVEFYPKSTAESLFGEVSAALRTGAKVRDVITNILKCKGGRTHKTRSYTVHGKTLMIWLLTNYGDEALLQLEKVKRFLEDEGIS